MKLRFTSTKLGLTPETAKLGSTPPPNEASSPDDHSSNPAQAILHRALRLSIPGAMLFSLPVGILLHEQFLRPFRLALGSVTIPIQLVVIAAVATVSLVTLFTSFRAIVEASKTDQAPFLSVCLILFNVAALLTAGFAIIAGYLALTIDLD